MAPPEASHRPDPFHDLAGTWWEEDGTWHALGELLDPVRVPFLTETLANELGGVSGRVLDLGAGGGRLSAELADLGFAVTALDPSWPALRAGREHTAGSRVRFVAGRGERLPFADDSFDAVVCMEALEHVEEPAAVVAEASRVLRTGGPFVYSGPNRTATSGLGLVLVAQVGLGIVPRGTHRWRRLLRPAEIGRLMRSAGIEPRRVVGVGIAANRVPAAVRAIVGLLMGRLSHPGAAGRIELKTTSSTRVAYQGYGVRSARGRSSHPARAPEASGPGTRRRA